MVDSILVLADEFKDQPLEALARRLSWDGETEWWDVTVQLIDGNAVAEDRVQCTGNFMDAGIDKYAQLTDAAGLAYRGSGAWNSNEDRSEWSASLFRKSVWG